MIPLHWPRPLANDPWIRVMTAVLLAAFLNAVPWTCTYCTYEGPKLTVCQQQYEERDAYGWFIQLHVLHSLKKGSVTVNHITPSVQNMSRIVIPPGSLTRDIISLNSLCSLLIKNKRMFSPVFCPPSETWHPLWLTDAACMRISSTCADPLLPSRWITDECFIHCTKPLSFNN